MAYTLIASGLVGGCVPNSDAPTAGPPADVSVTSAFSETPPATWGEALDELIGMSDTVGKAFAGPLALHEAYQWLEDLMGEGFEARVEQDLYQLRLQIADVITKIAQGQEVVSGQLASLPTAFAQTAAENARSFAMDTGGAVYDPNTNPAAALADTNSRAAAIAFEDDAWYSAVSPIQNAPRVFEWRLGLPHLIGSITYRLEVMAAVHPDYLTTGHYTGELLEYYDQIGRRLTQADNALISCVTQTVVIPPGSDPNNISLRSCRNSQTGTVLNCGTLAKPIPDAVIRAQLMDQMGFDKIRAFRERLYTLANALPRNLSFCAQESQTCASTGIKTAKYGAGAAYNYRTVGGRGFACNNDVFGDPLPATFKSCSVGDLNVYPCSDEDGTCYFNGVQNVMYGAGGRTISKLAIGGIACTNGEFGDPKPGWFKSCAYHEPVWTRCAAAGGTCTLAGTNFVRYGYGDKFVYWKQTGSVACNTSHGDPAPGQPKVCEVAVPRFPMRSDVDGDHKDDLIMTSGSTWNTIPVAHYSNSDGTFTYTNAWNSYWASNAATPGAKVVTGDFDGDGDADLAMTMTGGPILNAIIVASSNRDGSFTVSSQPNWYWASHAAMPNVKIVSGDFNNDGRDDLAMMGYSGWNSILVAFSNGDGTFNVTDQENSFWALIAAMTNVKVVSGDFNGDGRADLAMAGNSTWGSVPVAFSNGDGTFNVTNVANGFWAVNAAMPNVKMVSGDFNADGVDDLAMTGNSGWGSIPVAFSNLDGSFTVTNYANELFAGYAAQSNVQVTVGDYDGDGRDDLALMGHSSWTFIPVAFSFAGDGTFRTVTPTNSFWATAASQSGVKVVDRQAN